MHTPASKPLSRDFIKSIAMLTMLLNHIAHVFLTPGTFLWELMVDIGYFTAITMCFFLVEGYRYTHSRKKYAQRLALFAAISQFPFCLAFSEGVILQPKGMNMMFTLLLCFLIICILDDSWPVSPAAPVRLVSRARSKISESNFQTRSRTAKHLQIWGLVLLSIFSDWPVFAPAFTILFWKARDSRQGQIRAYRLSALWFGISELISNAHRLSLPANVLSSLGAAAAISISGYCTLCLYNGKRIARGRSFFKWFFYLFYPVHLLVLGILRVLLL